MRTPQINADPPKLMQTHFGDLEKVSQSERYPDFRIGTRQSVLIKQDVLISRCPHCRGCHVVVGNENDPDTGDQIGMLGPAHFCPLMRGSSSSQRFKMNDLLVPEKHVLCWEVIPLLGRVLYIEVRTESLLRLFLSKGSPPFFTTPIFDTSGPHEIRIRGAPVNEQTLGCRRRHVLFIDVVIP